MIRTFTLLFLTLFVFSFQLQAQTDKGVVSGYVYDVDGGELPFATVILLNKSDSSMAKAGYTNDKGKFNLIPVAQGDYFLKVTYTSMSPYTSAPFSVADGESKEIPKIVLDAVDSELETVKIRAQKPLITIKPDMTVFNVDASVNAIGSDALELLRKAPGVIVDNNDNIILQGKNGVRIYIDGKPSPLSASDLSAMLKGMQSSQIESIEIITNPSAKYDAEGNAGIINIVLKKDKSLGANANLDLGYGIQRFAKYNGSITANYRSRKVNVFGSLGGNKGLRYNFMKFYRIQADTSGNSTIFDQTSDMINDGNNINGKVGADFFLSDKSTLGFMANGFVSNGSWTNTSTTYIQDEATGTQFSILNALSDNSQKRVNNNYNINYGFKDKEKGTSWNVDADYGFFNLDNDAFQPNVYYNGDSSAIIGETIFTTSAPTDINIATFKIDHERNFLKGKLGFGGKTSYVRTTNDFQFFDRFDGMDTLNLDQSNKFDYTENVNALYLTWQRQYGKWGVSGGLRAEQTNSLGVLTSTQVNENDTVDRNYLNFFPSGGLTYQANRTNMFRLNYSRRIDRPRYENLNPFLNRLDELTYRQGNPFLQPQYSNSLELTHVLNYRISTSLKYSRTTDMMTQITDTVEGSRTFMTTRNLASQDVISLYLSLPQSITKWWSTFTNTGVFRTRNVGDFGEVGKEIDFSRITWSIYHQSTFTLPKDFSMELSGFFTSPSIWGANFRNRSFGGMDIGARKRFLDGRGSIKVSLSDVLYTMQWRGIQEYGGLYMDASGGWESRQFKVNLTYLFGNDKLKSSRRRKTGLDDEKNRAGGGGGGQGR